MLRTKSCDVKRVMRVNGPEPTGFGFEKVSGFATFDQMWRGMTMAPFSVAATNC